MTIAMNSWARGYDSGFCLTSIGGRGVISGKARSSPGESQGFSGSRAGLLRSWGGWNPGSRQQELVLSTTRRCGSNLRTPLELDFIERLVLRERRRIKRPIGRQRVQLLAATGFDRRADEGAAIERPPSGNELRRNEPRGELRDGSGPPSVARADVSARGRDDVESFLVGEGRQAPQGQGSFLRVSPNLAHGDAAVGHGVDELAPTGVDAGMGERSALPVRSGQAGQLRRGDAPGTLDQHDVTGKPLAEIRNECVVPAGRSLLRRRIVRKVCLPDWRKQAATQVSRREP